jgi:hypothetical protein
MAAAAALLVGAILGFIFALPRTLERSETTGLLATNSNLDQVSDWITKIIVALGLIELGRIASGVDDIGNSVAEGLGDGTGAHTFALSILIYSVIDGFLVSYLWTRIVISVHLKDAAENLAQASEISEVISTTPPPAPPPAALPPPSAASQAQGAGTVATTAPAAPPPDPPPPEGAPPDPPPGDPPPPDPDG